MLWQPTFLILCCCCCCCCWPQVRELHDEAVFETECLGVSDPGMEKVRDKRHGLSLFNQ
jgi:hypothetical protein